MWKIKINLNAIKANTNLYKEQDIETVDTNNADNIKTNTTNPKILPKVESPPKEKVGITEENNKKINPPIIKPIKISTIKKGTKIEKKVDKTKISPKRSIKEGNLTENIENKKETKALFDNYESNFQINKISILERLKRLKSLPKTNVILLTILITTTIAWIWFLFYSNPKIHNLNNYKTSIIDTYNAIYLQESSLPKNIPKIEKINKWWYIYNIKIKKLLWKNVYIYKWKYFDKRENLDSFINKEIEYRKRNKVVKVLKHSFSK